MNTPKWQGVVRHILSIIGTLMVTFGILEPEDAQVIPDLVFEAIGAILVLYAAIKSVLAREKQLSEQQYAQLKG